jgi:hypothetical protein
LVRLEPCLVAIEQFRDLISRDKVSRKAKPLVYGCPLKQSNTGAEVTAADSADLTDRFNLTAVILFFFFFFFPALCVRLQAIACTVLVSRWCRGRLIHPEARTDSPQIARGRELLAEIIRFACRRFGRAVSREPPPRHRHVSPRRSFRSVTLQF